MKNKPALPLRIQAHSNRTIEAGTIRGTHEGCTIKWLQAEAGEGEGASKPKSFTMLAYTGGPMNVGFGDPVIVDLAGLKVTAHARPILRDHNPGKPVGNTTKVVVGKSDITVEGILSGANDDTREIIESAANGFPWQASIGADVESLRFVEEGQSVEVNGKTWKGPLLVATKSTLKEISFVPLGADDNTVASVAAQNNNKRKLEIPSMGFIAWLKAKGFDHDTLTEEQKAGLRAMYDAEQQKLEPGKKTDDNNGDAVAAMRAAAGAESLRIAKINAMSDATFTADGEDWKKGDSIKAHAIAKGWDANRAELETLRASMKTPPAAIVANNDGETVKHLEAGFALAVNMPKIDKHYTDEQLTAAQKRFGRRGLGLQEMLIEAARANGYTGRGNFRDSGELKNVLQAAFSTNVISGILSNIANKYLVRGFDAVEGAWREVTATRPANDFKEMTGYRLTDALTYEKIGNSGEIKHGTLGEAEYGNKVDTYARMVNIPRPDLVNDDLGALTVIPQKLGRGAALSINQVFWAELLDDASFFTVGNSNLKSGASSALSLESINVANVALRTQTDEEGNPLGALAEILLVPASLEARALNLMRSTTVNRQMGDSSAEGDFPDGNPYAGRYRVISSAYLDAASTTAWYLLANPVDIAIIETAFLNGQETPTIESADVDFNQLGIQMRGYADFGVRKQEYRGGVKSTGA